jgi:hypothetical protein
MQRRGGLGMRLGFLLVVVGALVMIRRQLSPESRAPRWDEMNYSDCVRGDAPETGDHSPEGGKTLLLRALYDLNFSSST